MIAYALLAVCTEFLLRLVKSKVSTFVILCFRWFDRLGFKLWSIDNYFRIKQLISMKRINFGGLFSLLFCHSEWQNL